MKALLGWTLMVNSLQGNSPKKKKKKLALSVISMFVKETEVFE